MPLAFLDTEFSGLDDPVPDLVSIALVRDDNEFFYAELKESEYRRRIAPWTRDNVIPLLWGGSWSMSREEISQRLVSWITECDDKIMVITDSPEYDYELMKPLLNPWPQNLAISCMRFDSLAMGRNRQPWLMDIRDRFHEQHGPAHHALRDAQSLREMYIKALEAGWWPTR